MSRSRKEVAGSTWCCCKSQKKGKRFCNRKFRRKEHQLMAMGEFEKLPYNLNEAMEEWDLGGDGKHAWFFSSSDYARGEEWYKYYLTCLRK